MKTEDRKGQHGKDGERNTKMGDQEKLDEFVANKVEGGLTKQEKIAISRQAAKLKDVNINLAYARMAVSFVKQKVSLVANWDERLDTSAEGIYRVGLERAKSSNEADHWGVQDLQDIQILSDLAEQHGCGNCGELTAVTFMCLYHLSVRPLEILTRLLRSVLGTEHEGNA